MELNLNSEFNLNFSCNGVKTYVVYDAIKFCFFTFSGS